MPLTPPADTAPIRGDDDSSRREDEALSDGDASEKSGACDGEGDASGIVFGVAVSRADRTPAFSVDEVMSGDRPAEIGAPPIADAEVTAWLE